MAMYVSNPLIMMEVHAHKIELNLLARRFSEDGRYSPHSRARSMPPRLEISVNTTEVFFPADDLESPSPRSPHSPVSPERMRVVPSLGIGAGPIIRRDSSGMEVSVLVERCLYRGSKSSFGTVCLRRFDTDLYSFYSETA